MIKTFRDRRTERLSRGEFVKDYEPIAKRAKERLASLTAATSLQDLAAVRGHKLEPLKGDRAGQYSVRITINGVSASSGMTGRDARSRWKLSTITDRYESNFLCVVHPGGILGDELRELRVSARELARQIDVPANRITQIIRGQRGISGDTALRLGHWFGMSAEFWMNLQKTYELNLARSQVGDAVEKLPQREPAKEAAE